MSRFFANASELTSSSESEEQEEEKPKLQRVVQYLSDNDDIKRTVKPAKEKRCLELSAVILLIKNLKKIRDCGSLLNAFEDFVKIYSKFPKSSAPPKMFLVCLIETEDFINSLWEDKEYRKSMPKLGSRALVALRQKFKKFYKEFANDIANFQENPNVNDSEDCETVEDSADVASASNVKSDQSGDSGEDSSNWSDSDIDDDKYKGLGSASHDYFLKKSTGDDEIQKRDKKGFGRNRTSKNKEKTDDWTVVTGGANVLAKGSNMFKNEEVTFEAVVKKLREVISTKSNKRSVRKQQLEAVKELEQVIDEHQLGEVLQIKVKYALACCLLSYNPNFLTGMKYEYWEALLRTVTVLSNMLTDAKDLKMEADIGEAEEDLENAPYRLYGSVASLLEQLDEEFGVILKACDPHSTEYAKLLKQEATLVDIIEKMLKFVEEQGNKLEVCRVYIRKIDHLYFKVDAKVFDKNKPDGETTAIETISKLCKFVYQNDTTNVLRTRAIIAQIYHSALHDRWTEARDLMLMSHLQENIQHSDIRTQILYNRAMAQLGLCAFRAGFIIDAHNCLEDLVGIRMKELLGQGFQYRRVDRTREQEQKERQAQVPFHAHIPLEVLECVYYISAMLNDVAYLATQESDQRRRMISKSFYHQLRLHQRLCFVGPPDSMREHVLAATRALLDGRWQDALELVVNKKMKTKVWRMVPQPFDVAKVLTPAFKLEGLKVYIIVNGDAYNCLSLVQLATQFELELGAVRSAVTKMIRCGEVDGTLDSSAENLLLSNKKWNPLLLSASVMADKLRNLADSNERILDPFFRQKAKPKPNNF